MDTALGLGAGLVLSSQFTSRTRPHKAPQARLFGSSSFKATWLWKCESGSDVCPWQPNWVYTKDHEYNTIAARPQDTQLLNIPSDEKGGINPVKVIMSHLSGNTMKPFAQSLLYKRDVLGSARKKKTRSELCLSKYAMGLVSSDGDIPTTNTWTMFKGTKATKNKIPNTKSTQKVFRSLAKMKKEGHVLAPEDYARQYVEVRLCKLDEESAACSHHHDSAARKCTPCARDHATGTMKTTCKAAWKRRKQHCRTLKKEYGCSHQLSEQKKKIYKPFNARTVADICPSCHCRQQKITAVAIQGDAKSEAWVSRFRISYYQEGPNGKGKWKFYKEPVVSQSVKESTSPLAYSTFGANKDSLATATSITGVSNNYYVKKTYLALPFMAKKIRFHPECWYSNTMAMRVEVYSCLHDFNWSPLQKLIGKANKQKKAPNTAKKGETAKELTKEAEKATVAAEKQPSSQPSAGAAAGSGAAAKELTKEAEKATVAAEKQPSSQPSVLEDSLGQSDKMNAQVILKTMTKLSCKHFIEHSRIPFQEWNLGMSGSGSIYQTLKKKIQVNGDTWTFVGYQRRVVQGAGLLQKQLLCYIKPGEVKEKCCVSKNSRQLDPKIPWAPKDQALATKLM
jgi:hypothetical protein